jgi:CRP-like cAMP-binding protein
LFVLWIHVIFVESGLPGLLRLPYDTSVTAQSDVQLQMLSVQSFREVCARYPEVMDVVCRNCGVDASIASALRSKPIAPPQSVIRLRARRAAARQQIKKDV